MIDSSLSSALLSSVITRRFLFLITVSSTLSSPLQEQAEPHHCDHAKVLELYQRSASKADLVRNSVAETLFCKFQVE